WDTSAAGHVAQGEDYAEAAPRELLEELGLAGGALQPLCELAASADTGHEFVRAYVCLAAHEPVPDPGEIAAAGWWPVAELARWIAREPERFTGTFRLIAACYFATSQGQPA